MSGRWEGSTRRAQLPADWKQIRARIIARDHGICQWPDPDGTAVGRGGVAVCGARGTDVDHIVRGADHREANLQLLCRAHHGRKSAAEGGAARQPMHRPPTRHPALG